MSEHSTTWTKEEFKAYLLIHCAHANLVESEEEQAYIRTKVRSSKYHRMHEEYDNDNDFQRIQKIQSTAERHNLNKDEIEVLKTEIVELFLSDGTLDTLEKNLFMGLGHILE